MAFFFFFLAWSRHGFDIIINFFFFRGILFLDNILQFIEVEHRKKENKIHIVKSTSNIFFLGLVLVMKFIIILIYNTRL